MLKVKEPGFYTTVQDSGRKGYRHLGVPVAGACDRIAAGRVNSLLENDPGAALLEMTMQGPVLVFTEPTYIALSGADMEVTLNGDALAMEQVHRVAAGSELRCSRTLHGFRTYLGIKGGFRTEEVLGSRSYYPPVTKQRKLIPLMELPYEPTTDFEPKLLKLSPSEFWKEEKLEAYPGPEYDLLNQKQREMLYATRFTLGKEHDRMACQLQEHLPGHLIRMITSATLPGTVQLTPAGRLIILLRDGQTTGGYPRVLQLSDRAVSVLAQKHTADHVRFVSTPF
ncbi:biotin-dependent carboxyltransferase family protein [Robiginitalea sp. SC105]|uniref:5-oxoprolinase subunit C family protein n=1 Tax=Robiginitalea sp. SC105 TaxID=2762332 RepID=UPI00163AE95B|nr:biotin-dependent carboxyltransferase family protein [Robiginitalea sp. SC105]MBC2840456.1 biotin-dependent carboxyltransferase family protein [Robiginitalea sp. SC105]